MWACCQPGREVSATADAGPCLEGGGDAADEQITEIVVVNLETGQAGVQRSGCGCGVATTNGIGLGFGDALDGAATGIKAETGGVELPRLSKAAVIGRSARTQTDGRGLGHHRIRAEHGTGGGVGLGIGRQIDAAAQPLAAVLRQAQGNGGGLGNNGLAGHRRRGGRQKVSATKQSAQVG